MNSFRSTRKVAFSDTDAAGVLHFSRTLVYIEDAEHAWLKELGFEVGDSTGWPRVHVECDYSVPCRFGDELEIQLNIEKIGKSSLTYHFLIWKEKKQQVAEGKIALVRVNNAGDKLPFLHVEKAKFK